MKVLECEAAKKLIHLYNEGGRQNWQGIVGDSVSRWLTSKELMEVEAELDLNSEYFPMEVREPRLARECFLFCCHGDILTSGQDGMDPISLMVFQVNGDGDRCRVLWESGEENHPPLEMAIHFTAHAAQSKGPGSIVYHCQPLNTMALGALVGEDEAELFRALRSGYAALSNMLPDGVGVLRWDMPHPLQRGVSMDEEIRNDMKAFMSRIKQQMKRKSLLVLLGEGTLCAGRSEITVLSEINAVERAAIVRLKMLSAGVRDV